MKYTSDYLELAPTLLAPTRFPWGSYLGQTVPLATPEEPTLGNRSKGQGLGPWSRGPLGLKGQGAGLKALQYNSLVCESWGKV